MRTLTRKQRLLNQIRGKEVDRIPMIGGWNLGVQNLAALAGITVDEYLKDPFRGVVGANHSLGVDAMTRPIVPTDIHAIRESYVLASALPKAEPEALKERGDAVPDTEREVLAQFDPVAIERGYREYFQSLLPQLDGIELVTTVWEALASVTFYGQYGYEGFFSAMALYPESLGRIYCQEGILARARNRILVRLMKEYEVIPLLFCGHDICNNQGPMYSPAFLRKYYWMHAKVSLEPVLEAGIRVIAHCDGNVMPLIDDLIAAGFSGFQGFQYECGVDPYELKKRRSLKGESPLFFTGLSVTRTLPAGTPEDVEEEVEYFLDLTDGGRGMFLFTSNVTGVEVPPQNIVAAYRHLAAYDPRKPRVGAGTRRQWPWGVSHPQCKPGIEP